MSDLVKRLRQADRGWPTMLSTAADRIEQLERGVSRLIDAFTSNDKRLRDQLAAEKALADRLAVSAKDAAAYAKDRAEAEGGLDYCDTTFSSDYDFAMAALAAYRKARGL